MELNLNPKSQVPFSHPVNISETPSPDKAPITDNEKKWVDNQITAMKEKDSYRAGQIERMLKNPNKGYEYVHKNWHTLEKIHSSSSILKETYVTESERERQDFYEAMEAVSRYDSNAEKPNY